MNTKPDPAATKTPEDEEAYVQGDPIPAPQAVEANTDSTWALFSDVVRQDHPEFEATVPAVLLADNSFDLAPRKPDGKRQNYPEFEDTVPASLLPDDSLVLTPRK